MLGVGKAAPAQFSAPNSRRKSGAVQKGLFVIRSISAISRLFPQDIIGASVKALAPFYFLQLTHKTSWNSEFQEVLSSDSFCFICFLLPGP